MIIVSQISFIGLCNIQVTTGQGSTKDYTLEVRAARGGGVLALDDISVDLVPLVGEQYVREEEGDPSCLESLFFIPQDKDIPQDDKDQCQTAIVITEDDRQHFKCNFEELPNFDL